MSDSTLWWLAAGGLIAVELLTGTFYLLMIALGLVAAALAAHAGLAHTWQWVCAATLGGGSVGVWWGYQSQRKHQPPNHSNQDVIMDVGETVHVDAWLDDRTCGVKYRGAHWEAVLQEGDMPKPGSFVITGVMGNKLILAQPPISQP